MGLESPRFLVALESLHLEENELRGPIPAVLTSLAHLRAISLASNRLGGSIPARIGSMRALWYCIMHESSLTGSLPEAIGELKDVRSLSFDKNSLAGTIPEILSTVSTLRVISVGSNLIRGTLPGFVWSLGSILVIMVERNGLSGFIPSSLSQLSTLWCFHIEGNRFRGSLALERVVRFLAFVSVADNLLTGTIPEGFCLQIRLVHLFCSSNWFEGLFPRCLSKLSWLRVLGMSSAESGAQMRGCLPDGLNGGVLVAHSQRWEGPIPAFKKTLDALSLHRNALQGMSELRFKNTTSIVLHRNRLSCLLPSCNNQSVSISIVAVGNHLVRTNRYPDWVSPFERDGLFWLRSDTGTQLLLRVLASSMVWALSVKVRGRLPMLAGLTASLKHCPSMQTAGSLLNFLTSHLLWSFILLMLILGCDFYTCPTTVTLASACLSESSLALSIVVVLWGRLSSHAMHPRWIRAEDGSSQTRSNPGVFSRSNFVWAAWIVGVIAMSTPAAVIVAAKCMPAALTGKGGGLLPILDVAIGTVQGLLNGAIMPWLAIKIYKSRHVALMSCANFLSPFVVAGLVVLYLDEECLDHWKGFWKECNADAQILDVEIGSGLLPGHTRAHVLSYRDVCSRTGRASPATCTRSLALKLQDLWLGKQIMAAFVLPSARLVTHFLYQSSAELVLKLALTLQLGVFCGAPLPLIGPLLWMAVLNDRLIAALADGTYGLAGRGTSHQGAAAASMIMTVGCSAIFHVAFVLDDPAALRLLCAMIATAGLRILVHKVNAILQHAAMQQMAEQWMDYSSDEMGTSATGASEGSYYWDSWSSGTQCEESLAGSRSEGLEENTDNHNVQLQAEDIDRLDQQRASLDGSSSAELYRPRSAADDE